MQLAVAALFDDVVRNQAPETEPSGIDIRATRYIFNPFETIPLTTFYARQFGMTQVSAGVILPIRPFTIQEQDATVVNRANLIAESDSPEKTAQRKIPRYPGIVVEAMKREFAESYKLRTGFCEITSLIGFDKLDVVRQMNEAIFNGLIFELDENGKLRKDEYWNPIVRDPAWSARQRIEYLSGTIKPQVPEGMWKKVLDEVIEAYRLSQAYGLAHYQRLNRQLEAFANNQANGKAEVSDLDYRICHYVDMKAPRRQSKLVQDEGGPQQSVKVEVVAPQAVAPAQDPALTESGPCPNCWLTIPYRNRQPAPLCSHCGVPTNELVTASAEPAKAEAKEVFDRDKPMGDAVKPAATEAAKTAKPPANANQPRK